MKKGQDDFFLLIRTLPTFWTTQILILIFIILWIFWDSKFPDFQVPRSTNLQISRFPDAAACGGQILRSQPDPSPNAHRDQIHHKERLLNFNQNTMHILPSYCVHSRAKVSQMLKLLSKAPMESSTQDCSKGSLQRI